MTERTAKRQREEHLVDQVVLGALRAALHYQGEVLLVTAGKRPENRGLFPKRSGPFRQAIKTCLDIEQPLFDLTREERKGKVVHQLVKINDRGIETLVAHLPVEEYESVIAESADSLRLRVVDKCVGAVHRRFEKFEMQRKEIVEAQHRAMAALLDFATGYLDKLETEKQRLDHERQRAAELREKMALQRADQLAKQAEERPILEPALSEKDLDFQRDLSEELVYAWQDAESREAQDYLARVLANIGVARVGEEGQRTEFDGRWQISEDSLSPGTSVEVVRPGWRLVNRRGNYLIARARVRKADLL